MYLLRCAVVWSIIEYIIVHSSFLIESGNKLPFSSCNLVKTCQEVLSNNMQSLDAAGP